MLQELCATEIAAVRAGIGGGFAHTNELHVMKYNQAMQSKDVEEWMKEVENEHKCMIEHRVWTPVKKYDIPKGTKLLDSTWALKKKSKGKLHGRLNAREFKQVPEGQFDQMLSKKSSNNQNCLNGNVDGHMGCKCHGHERSILKW